MYIGILAEWNPFHEGHAHLLSSLRTLYGNVPMACVMSGAFVQRGEPALFDKWTRASWALQGGADIAAELPAVCALQSADRFAAAGAVLIAAMGCTHMAFGTESLSGSALTAIAAWTLTDGYAAAFRAALQKGLPYSSAANTAIASRFPGYADDLSRPNNLLGIQYARAIAGRRLPLSILTIRRDTSAGAASATSIREAIAAGRAPTHIPRWEEASLTACLSGGAYTDFRRYDDACLLTLRLLTAEDLKNSGLFSEGLENRWYHHMGTASYEELLTAVKSKRYLYSRLRRIGAALLLSGHLRPSPMSAPGDAPYIRLLGMKRGASPLLRRTSLPVITSFARARRTLPQADTYLSMDARAADIQAWCFRGETARAARQDYYHSPVIL